MKTFKVYCPFEPLKWSKYNSPDTGRALTFSEIDGIASEKPYEEDKCYLITVKKIKMPKVKKWTA